MINYFTKVNRQTCSAAVVLTSAAAGIAFGTKLGR